MNKNVSVILLIMNANYSFSVSYQIKMPNIEYQGYILAANQTK